MADWLPGGPGQQAVVALVTGHRGHRAAEAVSGVALQHFEFWTNKQTNK